MSLHIAYMGKKLSVRKDINTGKVILAVMSGDLLLPPYTQLPENCVAVEQHFEFHFEEDSAELMVCLRLLVEVIQD